MEAREVERLREAAQEIWPSPDAAGDSREESRAKLVATFGNVVLIAVFLTFLGWGFRASGLYGLFVPCGADEHERFAERLVLSALEDGELYRSTVSLRTRRELAPILESLRPSDFELHFVDDCWGALYFCVDFSNGQQGQVVTYNGCQPPEEARFSLREVGAQRYWHE